MSELTFKQLRESYNLSQEECAAVLDLSLAAIRKIEQREKNPTKRYQFSPGNRRNYKILQERMTN